MSDVRERLRSEPKYWGSRAIKLCGDALDEIERLRTALNAAEAIGSVKIERLEVEIELLRAALRDVKMRALLEGMASDHDAQKRTPRGTADEAERGTGKE